MIHLCAADFYHSTDTKAVERPVTHLKQARSTYCSNALQDSMADLQANRSSPLLDLPPELRTTIYEMVAHIWTFKIRACGDNRPMRYPGLLFTCRGVSEEFGIVMYRCSAVEARIRDMYFRRVIQWLQCSKGIWRKALLANPRITLCLDEYSSNRHTHEDLSTWLCYRNKHQRSGKPLVHFRYEITETCCRRTHDWETGDWFLIWAGYYELYWLYNRGDVFDRRTLWPMLAAFWNFAHPEMKVGGA